jgi:hypothetical protein
MAVDSPLYLTLGQLARRLPAPDGQAISPSTVFRWATRGIRGHRLATTVVGGRRFTTWEQYREFADKVQAGERGPGRGVAMPAKKCTRIRDAEGVLRKAGI